jgi:hypothetical protein
MATTACFARKVALWFERGGVERVADPVWLRQMNMAIALAASRWNEFAVGPDAEQRMNAWLDEVERRAGVRGAEARAAIKNAKRKPSNRLLLGQFRHRLLAQRARSCEKSDVVTDCY